MRLWPLFHGRRAKALNHRTSSVEQERIAGSSLVGTVVRDRDLTGGHADGRGRIPTAVGGAVVLPFLGGIPRSVTITDAQPGVAEV